MMHTLTFETKDLEAIELLKGIAQKMGIEAREDSHPIPQLHFVEPKNEAARAFLELKKKYPPIRVPDDIDINGIIDEVNNDGYMFEDVTDNSQLRTYLINLNTKVCDLIR